MKLLLSKVLTLLLCLFIFGCGQAQFPWSDAASSSPINIAIQAISSVDQAGRCTVQGVANLPDDTRLTLSAVRYLTPITGRQSEAVPYGILDRKFVLVEAGKWQAQLSLWQPTDPGGHQESWQLNPALAAAVSPQSTIEVLATVEPAAMTAEIKQQISALSPQQQHLLVSYTIDGDPYLQVAQSRSLPLPEVQTLAAEAPDQPHSPWQGRQSATGPARLSSPAALPFAEGDNLRLPPGQMMQ